MQHFLINPLSITAQHIDLVRDVLQEFSDEDLFLTSQTYDLNEYSIQFTHNILRTTNVEHNQTEYRIVSNTELGRGGHGVVYYIDSNMLVPNNGDFTYVKPNPPIIAKFQCEYISSQYQASRFKKRLNHEYEQSKNGHLNASKPVFWQSDLMVNEAGIRCCIVTGVLVMNWVPGAELFYLTQLLLEPLCHVSSGFRLSWTLELLRAFNEQVVKQNKTHGDLAPGNIMVDTSLPHIDRILNSKPESKEDIKKCALELSNALNDTTCVPQWKMNIIDFQSSEYLHEYRATTTYSRSYVAPEIEAVLLSIPHPRIMIDDEKPDLFSIGQDIASLWGVRPLETPCLRDSRFYPLLRHRSQCYFKDEPNQFVKLVLGQIYVAIGHMTHIDPAQRWTLNTSICFFEKMLVTYNQLLIESSQPVSPSCTTMSRPGSVAAELLNGSDSSKEALTQPSTPATTPSSDVDVDVITLRRSPMLFASSTVSQTNRNFLRPLQRQLTIQNNENNDNKDAVDVNCQCLIM